ncbi:hypothetical protein NDU88_005876 [Pleurodeles waltl]|uniref:Uncharacterized protein n=1 Tax=Pleurodeles waltl TaxID=8319 RepID=A0AAV7WD26_PLEWA|nr:hypothetical protein NDU88_005876 [Pleurodeles waltl]
MTGRSAQAAHQTKLDTFVLPHEDATGARTEDVAVPVEKALAKSELHTLNIMVAFQGVHGLLEIKIDMVSTEVTPVWAVLHNMNDYLKEAEDSLAERNAHVAVTSQRTECHSRHPGGATGRLRESFKKK